MRKITAVCLVLFLMTALLCSCGYRIALIKKEDETENETTALSETTDAPLTVPPVSETTTAAPVTEPPQSSPTPGIEVQNNFKPMAMDTASVIEYYTDIVNNVKIRCPGFVKKEYQDITDVTAGNGDVSLANRIVNLVATELLKSSGSTDATVKVSAHDDIAVLNRFPVFGKAYGCNLSDLSIVRSAVCYTDGSVAKIVITFNDQLNPEPGLSQFSEIMTPIKRQNIASGISEYLVVLDLAQYKFDFNYTGCELTCYADIETGQLISLDQKMIIDIDINMNLDLILFKTNVVKAKGRLINHLGYADFDWSI